MVAADFGHPIGSSFYVATRWHDPTLSRHQPGFVLALASAALLQRCGAALWDLGGTDSSAGMRYKESVSEIMPRPAFADLFSRVRDEEVGAGKGGLAAALAVATGASASGESLAGCGLVITEVDLFK